MTKRKKKFSRAKTIWLTILGFVALSLLIAALVRGNDVILLNPQGYIAEQQYRLMILSLAIMFGFGIPIVGMLYYFAWKYREDNEKVAYKASSDHGKIITFVIWALPTAIMFVLAAILLPATQKLEHWDPIESDKEPITVQVVAMRWKWLFIYPEHDIATVNFVQIPEDTPVQFQLTADEAPMNSFWIPHLGGMLYAMTEHVNRLNLIAENVGDYEGSAAEINGAGFAGMRFNTRVTSEEDFQKWVSETKLSSLALTESEYQKLLKPSENNEAVFYAHPDPELYSNILSKYSSGSHAHGSGEGYEVYEGHGGH